MKILQNETTNNNTTTTSSTTTNTTISKESHQKQQQQHQNSLQSLQQLQQHHTVEKRKAKTLKNKILQNVAKQQRQEQIQHQPHQHQQQSQQDDQDACGQNDKNHDNSSSAMTDESLNSNNNKNSNKNGNNSKIESKSTTKTVTTAKTVIKDTENKDTGNGNNNSDLIIAEAAKILLKNGLNGTNAAAAAAVATATATLLTAAATFNQLPPAVAHNLTSENYNITATTSILSSSLTSLTSLSSPSISDSSALGKNVTTTAAAAHAQLVAIATAAAAVNATNHKRLAAAESCSLSSSLPTTTTLSPSLSIPSSKPPNLDINNGLLENSANQKTPTSTIPPTTISSAIGAGKTTPTGHFTKPYKANSNKTAMSLVSSTDIGIIDYTLNSHSSSAAITSSSSLSPSIINLSTSGNSSHYTTATSHHNFLSNSNNINSHINHSDISRPISHQKAAIINNHKTASAGAAAGGTGYGGRLQFFKDGKFILELARSKDGEKGGWVSVPRKLFRTPSAATSSTVTPSATASTSAATIPSSLAASPAAAVGGSLSSYPKNECSNSLSFSDDNSSLQSSPWQRDHCWKQAAPRKYVSKELTFFYRRPAFHKLTIQAILLSHKKRRKPYDTSIIDNGILFGFNVKKQIQQQSYADKFILDKKEVDSKEVDKTTKAVENKPEKEVKCIELNAVEEGTQKITDADNKNGGAKDDKKKKDECDKVFDNKHIKAEDSIKTDNDDVEIAKVSSPSENKEKSTECQNIKKETKKEMDEVEKMNTSDCTEEEDVSSEGVTSSNFNVHKEDQQEHALKAEVENIKKGDEEKRLKKYECNKTRAKLTTIVQKLMDASTSRLAATAHSCKTTNQTASSQAASLTFTTSSKLSSSAGADLSIGCTKNQNFKVSPPSNTAASRLVEYHQQHVSPRKRILREFEKVSQEDSTNGAAGGKRSRSKNNNTNLSPASSNTNATTSSSTTSNKSMSLNTHNSNLGIIPKSSAPTVANNAPTKLYSSYSIHSLLGGGVSSPQSSSSSTSMSPSSKRSADMSATITSSTMVALSPYPSASFPLNAHSNNPSKSPERNSGKSSLNTATKSKRSPPYSSPMRETQSRSPISSGIGGYNEYGGQKSPRSLPDPAHNAFNKMRYANSGNTDSTASATNHQHQQHHLHSQQNYHHHPQTYYSPYMMSPHYVPPLSGSSTLSPNASSMNVQPSSTSSRSPRHHASAFRATTPTSVALTSTTHNIPSTQRGDLSPQRSTTSSPRETTPRTVPKKTASIRRQFASPTSTTQYHNNSNCSSPTTTLESRSEDQLNSERRTPINSNTSHQQHQQPQHLMQRGSPGNPNISGSPIHPFSYMYAHPPNGGNSPHTTNTAGSSSSISPPTANASVAAAAAAAAASYFPSVVGSPYYHPYISTLAAMRHPQMWMQHYQNAVAAATNPTLMQSRHPAMLSAAGAAARLSPPYHGFQYNGVGNAAALAAAAAAATAGFGSTPSTLQYSSNALSHPSSVFNQMTSSSLQGMEYSTTTLQAAGLIPASSAAPKPILTSATPMTDTTNFSKSSKNNFQSSTSTTGGNSGVGLSSLPSSVGSSENSIYTISNKDEQSSDVPLNLSKH